MQTSRQPSSTARSPPGPSAPTRSTSTHSSLDRKSTRLNSSHDQISYAVFCLKKKKKKNHKMRCPHDVLKTLNRTRPPTTASMLLKLAISTVKSQSVLRESREYTICGRAHVL